MSSLPRQRLIDGPDLDYLEASEVARYLRMSTDTLQRLIKRGVFPRPLEMTGEDGRVRLWTWRDVLYWTLYVELRSRMGTEDETMPDEPQPQETAKKGHKPA